MMYPMMLEYWSESELRQRRTGAMTAPETGTRDRAPSRFSRVGKVELVRTGGSGRSTSHVLALGRWATGHRPRPMAAPSHGKGG
jgi:hypothetical protein